MSEKPPQPHSFLSRKAVMLLMIALFLMFVIPMGGVFKALSEQSTERENRRAVQAEINRYVCKENNKQDRILAGLLAITNEGESSFGEGVDLSQLTSFDQAVLRSIAKVQSISGGTEKQLKVFEQAQRQLEQETPCDAIAQAFLEAGDTEDLRTIRRILYSTK